MLKEVRADFNSKTEQYVELLLKWNQKINLISPKTEDDIWQRHIEDCKSILQFIDEGDSKSLLDMGSGAGLPGVIIAINKPNIECYLVESDSRKCMFLQEVRQQLDLKNLNIINDRIENIDGFKVDIITARALASFNRLVEYSKAFLGHNPKLLFMKGLKLEEEIMDAKENFDFDYKIHEISNVSSLIEAHVSL